MYPYWLYLFQYVGTFGKRWLKSSYEWIIDQMTNFVNLKNAKFPHSLDKTINCDGGKVVIERLIRLFGVRNRLELAEVLGITAGTISTWTTRNTTPYEMLMRIHLATGVDLEYLCFGKGEQVPDVMKHALNTVPDYKDGKVIKERPFTESSELLAIDIFEIKEGDLIKVDAFNVDDKFKESVCIGIKDFAVKHDNQYLFINSEMTTPNNGEYLFSVNGTYQIGELRLLPDGQVYLMLESDKCPINNDTTKIHGKVVSVLRK